MWLFQKWQHFSNKYQDLRRDGGTQDLFKPILLFLLFLLHSIVLISANRNGLWLDEF